MLPSNTYSESGNIRVGAVRNISQTTELQDMMVILYLEFIIKHYLMMKFYIILMLREEHLEYNAINIGTTGTAGRFIGGGAGVYRNTR